MEKRKRNMKRIMGMTIVMLAASSCVSLAAPDADTAWTSIWTLLTTWIIRIGAGIAIFGGVNIGISFASDNPDSRVRGLQFLAAGLIVAAVGASPSIFGIL